jgi:hypothetical protein
MECKCYTEDVEEQVAKLEKEFRSDVIAEANKADGCDSKSNAQDNNGRTC